MKSCARCGRAGDDVTTRPHQATLCPYCRATADKERNKRRTWYQGRWPAVRAAALKTQTWCAKCGTHQDLEVDHVNPRSLDQGVQVLCRACHQAKP